MKAWQYCYECGQEYPTARSLRKAYREQQRQLDWSAWDNLWRCLTIRAKQIYFCQECTHDFLFPPKSWVRGEAV